MDRDRFLKAALRLREVPALIVHHAKIMMILRFGPSQPPGAFLPDSLLSLLLFPVRLIRHDGMAIATIAISCQGQARWRQRISGIILKNGVMFFYLLFINLHKILTTIHHSSNKRQSSAELQIDA